MRSLNFVSVKLTACLIVGIVLGFHFEVEPPVPLISILVTIPLLYWAKKKQPREGFPFYEMATILITTLLGMLVVGMTISKNSGQHYAKTDLDHEKLWHLKVREILKPNPFNQRFVTKIIALDNENKSGKIVLVLPMDSTSQKLQIDDELYVYSRAETIKPPLNPHQFNYKDYLKKQGIFHQIRAEFKAIIVKEESSRTLLGRASSFREHIISKLKKENFGEDELAVIQALLLGQRDDISESTYDNYKNAGAVHILAVSGLHVGILLLLLQFLLSPLDRFPKGKTLKLAVIVLLLWTYAFVAGLSPSIVRAVTMFSFLAYALYLNRPTNSFNIIALSMLFILLVKPLMLFQVGFQMSYAAVFAIVWIYPKLQRFWFPEHLVVRKTWQLLSVSVAAQLGVLPISLFYFHQFPALFFISNLLIVPFLGLILGIGILIVVLALIGHLPLFLVQVYNWVIAMMNTVVSWVGQQEHFIIKDIPFDGFQLILGYLILGTVVVLFSKPRWKTALIMAIGIMGMQVHAIWNQSSLNKKERLLLLHKSRTTVLFHQTGPDLNIYTNDSTNFNRMVMDYVVAERIESTSYAELKNNYSLNGMDLYIMDSLGIYPETKQQDFMLLTQSPKINLERLLDSIHPKMILADGSNYRSYIARWKQTCIKKEIPFHYTGEKGFYAFDLKSD